MEWKVFLKWPLGINSKSKKRISEIWQNLSVESEGAIMIAHLYHWHSEGQQKRWNENNFPAKKNVEVIRRTESVHRDTANKSHRWIANWRGKLWNMFSSQLDIKLHLKKSSSWRKDNIVCTWEYVNLIAWFLLWWSFFGVKARSLWQEG